MPPFPLEARHPVQHPEAPGLRDLPPLTSSSHRAYTFYRTAHSSKRHRSSTLPWTQAPKNNVDDLTGITSTCYKLNSLQLRAMLERYQPAADEPARIPPQLIDNIVRVSWRGSSRRG